MKTIETPCIHVCKIEGDRCIGCDRTRHEIGHWCKFTDEERRQIMERIEDETRQRFE
jgi:predicted Fe-S protein YdhL (DUF1289 family)